MYMEASILTAKTGQDKTAACIAPLPAHWLVGILHVVMCNTMNDTNKILTSRANHKFEGLTG